MRNIYYLMDSHQINSSNDDIISKYKLEKYCVCIDGIWQSSFVGFILTDDATFISFPKHYYNDIKEIKDTDIKLLSKLMLKTRYISGLDDKLGNYDNFPLRSYINVCSYYLKHGLYNETIKKKENNYKGRIDWKNTIKKSNKIISNNNLIFFPFIVEKNENHHVFITECMIYVLNHGFERFGKFFEIGVKYTKKPNNPIFRNKDLVIKQLTLLKASYFKDSERFLIQSLIDYIAWSSNCGNRTILATKNFESYWEIMVEDYLNSNLNYIDDKNNMFFTRNSNRFKFRKRQEAIESQKVRSKKESNKFNVEYDHLCVIKDNIAYLFDSKYYKDVKELNYKQMAYHYILKSSRVYPNKSIVNGLILPTAKDYYNKIHLDTRDRNGILKGIYIIEHYLNVKDVIESFVGS